MCRHGHHCAFAVAHQHIVGHPHRQLFAVERMCYEATGGHALLFHHSQISFGHAAMFAFLDEGSEFGIALRRLGCQRMLGGHGYIGRAHQGIGASSEHLQHTITAFIGEMDFSTEAFADPVLLHGAHLLRPPGQGVEASKQFLGISSDLHKVHWDIAFFHQRAGAPAASVDHLLVGQHGVVYRIPVHRRRLFVDQPFLEQLGEQPLFPLVVIRLAGCDFAIPVDSQSQTFQLRAHVIDVGIGPGSRRHIVGNRRILGGQPESVPAHGLHDVEALHAVVARQHVAYGVVAHMTHVQLAGGIGEHRQAIVFGLVGHFGCLESARFIPSFLGFLLYTGGGVNWLHFLRIFFMQVL
jgi:hypothetical protein